MSRQINTDIVDSNTEALEIIREEQCSPALSTVFPHHKNKDGDHNDEENEEETAGQGELTETCCACVCEEKAKQQEPLTKKIEVSDVEKMLIQRETELCVEFEKRLKKEINSLTDKFDYILRNEQTRASYMLTAAHKERQEKVMALQSQLECKNLAGMMFVMCSERTKSKFEKMRIIEEYTIYISHLQNLLAEGQDLILNLSRGYKTAARVDYEWKDKMTKVIQEFQNFVYHFAGGTPESNQYFFDLPKILKTEAPVTDNPNEDPCECENEYEPEPVVERSWWEDLESNCRPFVMLGDMSDFKPDRRRKVLKELKAAKTAPRKWKDYVFNEILMKTNCPMAERIKNVYENRVPASLPLECMLNMRENMEGVGGGGGGSGGVGAPISGGMQSSPHSRRVTTASMDARGMGSILKIITASGVSQPPTNKATLLGARDSIEITSTTKLREKSRQSMGLNAVAPSGPPPVLNVGSRRTSFYEEAAFLDFDDEHDHDHDHDFDVPMTLPQEDTSRIPLDESSTAAYSALAKVHTDSLEIIDNHVPDKDHKIHFEKVCPMDKCQRMHMDSFVRSLPPYMRANPFTHFESTYEKYEACTQEQLDILKKRIEDRKKSQRESERASGSPLREWSPSVQGVAAQTSQLSYLDLPPCTCRDPNVTPASSVGKIFKVEDLIPVKQKLDQITKRCLYDDEIEFDRFKVLGQPSGSTISDRKPVILDAAKSDFTSSRLQEIKNILRKHPSLCDIFQANTRC